MINIDKSIQELENDFWPDMKNYPTWLVQRCHDYRKIPLKKLQIHQIITLLIQNIGSNYLIPIVIERMKNNILEEDDYDGSMFFRSLVFFSDNIWKQNPDYYNNIKGIILNKQMELINAVGEKEFNKTLLKIEEKDPSGQTI